MTDALKQQIQHAKDALKKERDEAHAKTKERAQWIWANSDLAIYHSYLEIKRVKPHGLKIYKGLLAIPLADEFGEIVNLQLIAPDGTKKYLTGGKKQGCFAIIGELTDVILVAEGFATAATLFEQTGKMTVIAFDAGNLLVVATVIKRKYPQTDIIIAGDNDASGIGQAKANEAAVAVGGKLLIPPNAGQDWNDYTNAHALAGGAA